MKLKINSSIRWQSCPENFPVPRRKEVFIYKIVFSESDDHEKFFPLLSAVEIEKTRRFIFNKDKVGYSYSIGHTRKILATMLGISPKTITFEKGQHGKPYVAASQNHLSLQFNITHTLGCILIAVTREDEVGVDVENMQRQLDFQGVAKHYYHADECEFVTQQQSQPQNEYFFYIWTRKEAFIKAIGYGLRYELKKFSTVEDNVKDEKFPHWYTRSFYIDNYLAALTTLHQDSQIIFFALN
ncbi:MAG: 4'-phosphopantetheinyl transferase superfamily protein [Pseudomonadota bacterium]